MQWFVTEGLSKPPKDWLPPPRPSDNAAAYIEVYIFKSTFIGRPIRGNKLNLCHNH